MYEGMMPKQKIACQNLPHLKVFLTC